MHRLLRRRSLHIDTAVGGNANAQRGFRDIAPIATPASCESLVQHLLPQVAWPPRQWHALHRRAWMRLATSGVLFSLAQRPQSMPSD